MTPNPRQRASTTSRIALVWIVALALAGCAATLEDARVAADKGRMDEAMRIWEKLAAEGNATAAYKLARQYHEAEHVERDMAKALDYYRSAADGGHAKAAYWLGRVYHDGRHRPRDHDKAAEWFARAAKAGASEAVVYDDAYGGAEEPQFELGLRTHPVLGEGTARERYALSWRWFRLAAEQGHQRAKRFHRAYQRLSLKRGAATSWNPVGEDVYTWTALGEDLYQGSDGMPQRRMLAGWWFRPAALTGNPRAQYRLGLAYREVEGPARDRGQAANWFRKAAEQGYAKAQYELGAMYADGRGVGGKNMEKAEVWMRKAARQGNQAAADFLRERDL